MNKEEKEWISDCVYFQQYKGDMARFPSFDSVKLSKLEPTLYELRFKYLLAKIMFESYMEKLEQKD